MNGYISFSYNTNTLIMKCKGQAILIRYKDNSLYPSFTTCKKVTEMKINITLFYCIIFHIYIYSKSL